MLKGINIAIGKGHTAWTDGIFQTTSLGPYHHTPAGYSFQRNNTEWLIPAGKITLQRNYGDPPPPFEITALRTEEIAPVDLEQDLSTSMSSLLPVKITVPLFDVIKAIDEAYRLDENVFNIHIDIPDTPLLLHFRQPVMQEKKTQAGTALPSLFYFHTVTASEQELVKHVSIFRLYDVSSQTQLRDYNAEFIKTFTSGKKFALRVGGQYYLAGYENSNQEVLSFNLNRLRLTTLDGAQTFTPTVVTTSEIRFTLPSGELKVRINYATAKLEFSTGTELLTVTPFIGYMAELTTSNWVDIAGTRLRLCFPQIYASTSAAGICNAAGIQIAEANPIAVTDIDGNKYVLESNQQLGKAKQVKIRRLLSLNASQPFLHRDWFSFVGEIIAKREPVFNVSLRGAIVAPSVFYLPTAKNMELNGFGFLQYPSGTLFPVQQVQQVSTGIFNGSAVLQDRVVFLQQAVTSNESAPVNVSMIVQPYSHVPSNGDTILFQGAIFDFPKDFVLGLTGAHYQLRFKEFNFGGTLVKLELAVLETGKVIFSKDFANGDHKTVSLENTDIEIMVKQIIPGQPLQVIISIKRLV